MSHPSWTEQRHLDDPHGRLSAQDWAELAEYVAFQDAALELLGDGGNCGCCLSPRRRHCEHCHEGLIAWIPRP